MKMRYETERLVLEIFTSVKAEAVLQFYLENRKVFEAYQQELPPEYYTDSYQRDMLQGEYNLAVKSLSIRFWVYEKDGAGKIAGTVSLQNIRRGCYQSCELGYKFGQDFWGRGYARESILECLRIAFEELGLHRVEALALEENTRSVKLLNSLGFEWEGRKKQSIKIHGEWKTHELYALVSEMDR